MEKPSVGIKEQQGLGRLIDFNNISIPQDDEEILDGETFLNVARKLVADVLPIDSQNDESFYEELGECLLNLPSLEEMENPITINNIVNHQATDLSLQQKIMSKPDFFRHEELQGFKIIHARTRTDRIWKIAIPNTLLPQLVTWYHLVLGHCGQQRLYDTINARFRANNLQKTCIEVVNRCPNKCQMNKHSNKNYGHLPP